MLNSKRLLQMVKRWQKMAALGRRRIASTISSGNAPHSIANKGHIFVYSSDGKRFMIPLAYLSHSFFRELFMMAEEEFGLPSDGPITLPCDASFMGYIISLLRCGASKDVERAVDASISGGRCSLSSSSLQQNYHLQCMTVFGF